MKARLAKAFFCFLIFTSSVYAGVGASKSIDDPKVFFDQFALSAHPEANEKWISLTVTDRSKTKPNYLRNLHHGLYSSFVPWFNATGEMSHYSFEEMIAVHHVNTVFGKDGKPYFGYTPAAHGMCPTPDIHPGEFRHRMDPLPEDAHRMPYRIDVKMPAGRADHSLSHHLSREWGRTKENRRLNDYVCIARGY